MKSKVKIICTLGPSSINKKFLKFSKTNIDLLRLNMSHMKLNKLQSTINFIKRYTKTPICIDTEGGQIRTKTKKSKFFKINENILINKNLKKNGFSLYPEDIFSKMKKNDILNIGFDDLLVKIISVNKSFLKTKVLRSGILENNKGIHLQNRRLKMNFITKKDFKAIQIAKKNKVNFFALSFTSSVEDIKSFNKVLSKDSKKIFKIETKRAVENFKQIIKKADNFLIDRGDLSKDITVVHIPKIQRKLMSIKKNFKSKKIFVATNLLESMIENNYPTRGEANDIYSSLEMGASGLVLAAETAIGKNPLSCVKFIKEMIVNFNKK